MRDRKPITENLVQKVFVTSAHHHQKVEKSEGKSLKALILLGIAQIGVKGGRAQLYGPLFITAISPQSEYYEFLEANFTISNILNDIITDIKS